eukprot:CAMPEP_0116069992 /NCGR_PEP_ID=MMETSP0322-20121206/12688_1 /TAXON_ID=163516 /ORGANISM="Leptocylindrus danicus var. apora, Strain B651" /LENGTH=583 /DNA_ID=CAMNT_0003557603 /DNA_START=169 /DNA_END=1917 /DNA_ORIENTATION=+
MKPNETFMSKQQHPSYQTFLWSFSKLFVVLWMHITSYKVNAFIISPLSKNPVNFSLSSSHVISAAKSSAVSSSSARSSSSSSWDSNLNLNSKKEQISKSNDNVYHSEVPLVFIPGMKGTHLTDPAKKANSPRAWLSFGNLINFPPRSDDFEDRNLALPLTYSVVNDDESLNDEKLVQDRGRLRPDGIVNSIIEVKKPRYSSSKLSFSIKNDDVNDDQNKYFGLFPFYGQAVKLITDSNLSGRPNTACFEYDWRRSLDELSMEFEEFCEAKFPGQPVQVVAHSMGGIIAFGSMRRKPEKYAPGAVFVGVPFGTGIQYFQDLHRGYYTELNRCRQFLPPAQMSMSSHWSFFPLDKEEAGNSFVDVSDENYTAFVPDKSAIGSPGKEFQSAVKGKIIDMDFYNQKDWEDIMCGVFDPMWNIDEKTKNLYRNHMKIQLQKGKEWREVVYRPKDADEDLPPLVVCQSDKVPTINQILRRRKDKTSVNNGENPWEYDYVSGRSVPGDGRLDFDKSFPPTGTDYKAIRLGDVKHAKQMCHDSSGGSLDRIWKETSKQIEQYENRIREENEEAQNTALANSGISQVRRLRW